MWVDNRTRVICRLRGVMTALLTIGAGSLLGGVGVSTAAAEMIEYFRARQPPTRHYGRSGRGPLVHRWLAPSGCLGGVPVRLVPPGGITKIGLGCEGEEEEKKEFVGNGANGIAFGPEGNPWFTAGGGVGRHRTIRHESEDSEDFLLPPVKEAIEKSTITAQYQPGRYHHRAGTRKKPVVHRG